MYYSIDMIFLIDLILQFFMTIPECDMKNEVDDRRKIAIAYLKGWFIVDLLSILPFDLLL